MKTLDDLKEKAAKENSLKAMTEYRDAITDELKFGKVKWTPYSRQ